MDVRAIVIVGGTEDGSEQIDGVPIAALDILGRPVLLRVLDRMRLAGISAATVISGQALHLPALTNGIRMVAAGEQLWQAANRAFGEFASEADVVVLVRLGPYAEIRYDSLVSFHVKQKRPVTAVFSTEGVPMGAFVLNASAFKEAAYLVRHRLGELRQRHAIYVFGGYSNPLRSAAGLRRLAVDAFCRNADLLPEGIERKPGIWTAPNARINNRARVIAPVYIGEGARVRAAAVVTRCSVLERGACVGSGTVLENATLLQRTRVGAGLDIAHAVVGPRRLVHLGRKIEVEISDPRLVELTTAAPIRALRYLASLATKLPAQFLRRTSSTNHHPKTEVSSPKQSPYPALAAEEQFPAPLAGARRYGNE
jgi:carbonic anhydrase/acetyltransferase-like protein (isoleucine patch superfamily)